MSGTATQHPSKAVEFTVRGFTRSEIETCAARRCCERFGETGWSYSACEVTPCLRSVGGRVKLLEGRFVAVATAAVPQHG